MTHSALNVKGFSSSSPILSFSSRNRRKVFKTFLFTLEVEQRTILFSFRKLRKFCLISLSLLEKGNSYFSFSSQKWRNCFQISHFECGIGYDSFDPKKARLNRVNRLQPRKITSKNCLLNIRSPPSHRPGFSETEEVESDRATSSASPPWAWWAQLISWRLVVAITLPSLHHHQPRRQGHEG